MRRTLGVIFQDFRLIENKTVYENVAFAMRVIGAAPKEIKKRVPYSLMMVDLPEPDGPTRNTNSPSSMCISMPLSACVPVSYVFVTFTKSIINHTSFLLNYY